MLNTGPKTVLYKDLKIVPVKKNEELMVAIKDVGLQGGYDSRLSDMGPILNNEIYIRQSVLIRLLSVQDSLSEINPDLSLYITYGYRSLEVQKRYFDEKIRQFKNNFVTQDELYEFVHTMIAVPDVAGHPTGGAVDALIINKNNERLDFGSPIYDFSKPIYDTFNTQISKQAQENRMLLREVMMSQGFAPFDGEYWHFSYGDKERAFYYGQESAIYEQIEFVP